MVVKSRTHKRKFKRVKKTKGGVPVKYVKGSKNPKATEKEIKNTSSLIVTGKPSINFIFDVIFVFPSHDLNPQAN